MTISLRDYVVYKFSIEFLSEHEGDCMCDNTLNCTHCYFDNSSLCDDKDLIYKICKNAVEKYKR